MNSKSSENAGQHEPEMDLHHALLPYDEVLSFLQREEQASNLKQYCNGGNRNGRWFFQFYSEEFIKRLAGAIIDCLGRVENSGPVLEIMAGNGKLTEFLESFIERDIIATDAKTRRSDIAHPKWVKTMDAIDAIEEYAPALILVSWEPFYSDIGTRIVQQGRPLAWIGDPASCAVHSGILEKPHTKLDCEYALGRHDSFVEEEFRTDIYLFNCK
ncbi:MAG: hypothetical protein R6V83_03320 [Candidatus Thorarchaeota archaeon]